MNHIAEKVEHAVVKTEPWVLIDLEPGIWLTTSKAVDFYDDREDAIAAIKAEYPDYEASEWPEFSEVIS